MAIRFSCPCGRQFQVKDEEAGKRGKCPSCGRKVLIPTPEHDLMKRSSAEPPSRKKGIPVDGRRRRPGSSRAVNPILLVGGLVLTGVVILSAGLFVLSGVRAEPQQIVESKRIRFTPILSSAGLAREDSSGDVLCVTVKFSQAFLRATTGGQDNANLGLPDFRLLTDAGEEMPTMLAGATWPADAMEVPIQFSGPNDIAPCLGEGSESWSETDRDGRLQSSGTHGVRFHVRESADGSSCLPTLGKCLVESHVDLQTREVGGDRYETTGTVRAIVTGAAVGTLTMVALSGRAATDGMLDSDRASGHPVWLPWRRPVPAHRARMFNLSGTLESQLSDGSKLRLAYGPEKCRVSWTGDWKGVELWRTQYHDTWTVEFDRGAMVDGTITICCLFPCPPMTSRLAVRYKDAPPMELGESVLRSLDYAVPPETPVHVDVQGK